MPNPERYSRLQLEQYYARVQVPESARVYDVSSMTADAQLSHLELLVKHQLVTVPFENLTLHYSWHRVINTDAHHLFDKIVNQKRGGYCMENNSLFHVVLVSLGFDVYMAGARVHESDETGYGGTTHCLNIITIGGVRHVADVGFGPNGPIHPYILDPNLEQAHIAPARIRYRQGQLPGTTNKAGLVWIYEQRQTDDWVPMYCFADIEILLADVKTMNLAPSTSRTSIFQKMIMCVRFTAGTLQPQVDGGIDGVVILGASLKWRRHGKEEKQFAAERERIEALEEYFGIVLDSKDQAAIQGTATALKNP